jgi:malate synthase
LYAHVAGTWTNGIVVDGKPRVGAFVDFGLYLVSTSHRRAAFAIGGMAAFIPSRRDAEVNERAFAKVREDKEREAGDGFDGSWVAHPDLFPICREVIDEYLGDRPNQLDVRRDDVQVAAAQLLDVTAVPGTQNRSWVAR